MASLLVTYKAADNNKSDSNGEYVYFYTQIQRSIEKQSRSAEISSNRVFTEKINRNTHVIIAFN